MVKNLDRELQQIGIQWSIKKQDRSKIWLSFSEFHLCSTQVLEETQKVRL